MFSTLSASWMRVVDMAAPSLVERFTGSDARTATGTHHHPRLASHTRAELAEVLRQPGRGHGLFPVEGMAVSVVFTVLPP